jgi:SNF2 family DNA or RNA helicase
MTNLGIFTHPHYGTWHRLILTGTPIQNNLIEFWALVNWATSGNLLGTKAHFKARFVDPILAGQEPKVSATCDKLFNIYRNVY